MRRPPAKRQNLTHHVVQAEQGKPESLLSWIIRKATRKGSPRRCGHGMSEKANAGSRKAKQFHWPDRGLNVTSRESGQTSDWSFNTRKPTEPLERRKANDDYAGMQSSDSLCASYRRGMAPDRLGHMLRKRKEAASTHREGNTGRQVGEGESPPTSADPLVQRKSNCRQTSDRKPRQEHAGG